MSDNEPDEDTKRALFLSQLPSEIFDEQVKQLNVSEALNNMNNGVEAIQADLRSYIEVRLGGITMYMIA